jgi:ATP-dependent exoDNAse (exonuclease V) alpha subunit
MTQKTALSILKLGHTTFLTGAAGAGKSYVLREYITYLRRHGVRYAVTASTGIASTHINGTTIHAWSGIGIRKFVTARDLDSFEEKQPLYKRWNDTQVLIIDEVSMLSASFVDMLNKVGKHMRRSDKPFGGMQVIFCGDFFQLPPVIGREDVYKEGELYAFASSAWKEAKPVVCYLTEQHRQDDSRLSQLLNAIRIGEVEDEHYMLLQERNQVSSQDTIKLYTHNENVDELNTIAFGKLKGETREFHMITKGKASIVEGLKNSCLADEILRLKIGAKVICIKNAQDRSYVNGSMGYVVGFDKEGAPIIELVNGKKVTITADSWKIEEDGKVRAELTQLPLKLAWAITVHKSQGMTLDMAEIDLSRAFTGGQGYVALSRLRTIDGLFLKGFNQQALLVDDTVRETDKIFQIKSAQAEQSLTKYTEEQLSVLHGECLLRLGGTEEEQDDTENEVEVKTPSHTITQELLAQKISLDDIAKSRGISVDTIIGHIEKLVEHKEHVEIEHLLPKKKELQKIQDAFNVCDTTKLTPVFEYLKGKVAYRDLKLVRAYNALRSR